MKRRSFLKGSLATAPLLLAGPAIARAAQGQGGGPRVPHNIGPSTKTEPYLVPSRPGVPEPLVTRWGPPIVIHL